MSVNESDPNHVGEDIMFVSGLIAGAIVRTLVHPIDTLKTRMQVIKSLGGQKKMFNSGGLKDLSINLYRTEGIRGFYRGLGISLVGGAPGAGLYFICYERFNELYSRLTNTNKSFLVGIASGISAEIVSCVFWVAIDVIKERMQVMTLLKSYHYKNSVDAIRQILRNEGIGSLYRGYGVTVLTFGPYVGISMASFDKLKSIFDLEYGKGTFFQNFLLSSASACIASIITHPIDVVKVRLQVQRSQLRNPAAVGSSSEVNRSDFGYRNWVHGLKRIMIEEGTHGLYKGLSARLLLGVVTQGFHLSINDKVKYSLNAMVNRKDK